MEGLRKQALVACSQINFAPALNEHELITFDLAANKEPCRVRLPLPDILLRTQQSSTPPPTIRLAKLYIVHPPVGRTWEAPTLNASKDDVIRLWHLFDLDPTLLSLVAKGVRGFCQHQPAL